MSDLKPLGIPVRSVLFVCLGNICRSPLAEGVFRHELSRAGLEGQIGVDSAGTGSWHVGDPPDPRSQQTALANGIDISGQRCRQIADDDFHRFDLVIGMDRNNVGRLHRIAPQGHGARIGLFMDLGLGNMEDIPDPYTGTMRDFDQAFAMVQAASRGLLARIGGY